MQNQQFLTSLTDELHTRRFTLIKIVALLTAFVLCCALDAPAQTRRKNAKQKTASKTIAASTGKQNLPMIQTPQAVTIVNQAETDFLSGEASVAVNPKQPTVVRLGLAQNAVSIVEFPASDGIYYIHEGNPKFASVFQSPTKETDRSITIYPGEGFVAARDGGGIGATPSATITLQMRSGLVLILELVPVSDLRKNAHRCVVNYNREDVVAARRTAGLAYNLGEDGNPNNPRSRRASSKLVGGAGASDEFAGENANKSELLPVVQTSLDVSRGSISRKSDADKSSKKTKTALELSRFVNRRLADCLKNPKNLGAWSEAKNGLMLAVSSVAEIDTEQRLVVVAVRNQSTANLRLVPGTPELEIQTTDDKGNALQTERLERIYVETTSLEGLITPGSTSFYALVYRAPIMGASQRLRVMVSHREAADSPSVIALPSANAKKE